MEKTIKEKLSVWAGISTAHFNRIIRGGNTTAEVAVALEEATGIARGIWIFGTSKERREALKVRYGDSINLKRGRPKKNSD